MPVSWAIPYTHIPYCSYIAITIENEHIILKNKMGRNLCEVYLQTPFLQLS